MIVGTLQAQFMSIPGSDSCGTLFVRRCDHFITDLIHRSVLVTIPFPLRKRVCPHGHGLYLRVMMQQAAVWTMMMRPLNPTYARRK